MPSLKSSVVKIKCCGIVGSGFIISSDKIVTVNHNVHNNEEIKIEFHDLCERKVSNKLILREDRDLAILKLNCKGYHSLICGDFQKLQKKDKIVYAGYSKSTNEYKERLSFVASIEKKRIPLVEYNFKNEQQYIEQGMLSKVFFFDVPNVEHMKGMSGGPVINEDNKVIGILKGGYNNKQMAISIEYIHPHLKNNPY